MQERTILHCDMNGFYASVELLDLPQLKNRPMAVCGNPENRHGIILAKNELAKGFGIVTAETVWQAKRKCPELVLVPPHHDQYAKYAKLINEIYGRFTDMVEPFSIDESWLDVTASGRLFGTGKEIADQIRKTVYQELGLTLSAGVSFNKIFAKMGSDFQKPDATTVISRENYKDMLWPLPVRELFFVGKVTAEKLTKSGMRTIGDLANGDKGRLIAMLGKQGGQIYDYANGIDDSPVRLFSEKRKIKSVGNGMTFKRDLTSEDDIRIAVTALSDTVAGRLRKYQMKCQGVKVDVKDSAFKTVSRQRKMEISTNLAEEISPIALEIIKNWWDHKEPIRMITITGIGLVDEDHAEQLSLFSEKNKHREKSEKTERLMDTIRNKYGGGIITYGRILNNDIGIELHKEEEEDTRY